MGGYVLDRQPRSDFGYQHGDLPRAFSLIRRTVLMTGTQLDPVRSVGGKK